MAAVQNLYWDDVIISMDGSSGFSFEAGGWTFGPVVSHSMSGTLMPILRA